MNVIVQLEFELAYYDSAVHCFNHYTTRTPPPPKKGKIEEKGEDNVAEHSKGCCLIPDDGISKQRYIYNLVPHDIVINQTGLLSEFLNCLS